MNPTGYFLVVDAARRDATSALPHAPVLAEEPPRATRMRGALAAALRTAAERIEPRPRSC